MNIIRQQVLHTDKTCEYAYISYSLFCILLIHCGYFREIHVAEPSVMCTNIPYKRQMFKPAFKVCIACSVMDRNRFFISGLHIFIKFRKCSEAEKFNKGIKWDFTVRVVFLKIFDKMSFAVSYDLVVNIV